MVYFYLVVRNARNIFHPSNMYDLAITLPCTVMYCIFTCDFSLTNPTWHGSAWSPMQYTYSYMQNTSAPCFGGSCMEIEIEINY